MSVIRVGSNSTYADGWSNIFGKGKASPGKKVAKKAGAKKAARRKTAKKKSARKS